MRPWSPVAKAIGQWNFLAKLSAAVAALVFVLAVLSFTFGDGSALLGSRGPAPSPSFEVPPGGTGVSGHIRTGVSGHIIVGPTCPIVTPDCPPAGRAQGTVRIETAPETKGPGGGQLVKRVASDDNGAFAAALEPGSYVLVVEQSGVDYPLARPEQVRVDAGGVNHVTLTLDTGIR
jgi:hypothetical protein